MVSILPYLQKSFGFMEPEFFFTQRYTRCGVWINCNKSRTQIKIGFILFCNCFLMFICFIIIDVSSCEKVKQLQAGVYIFLRIQFYSPPPFPIIIFLSQRSILALCILSILYTYIYIKITFRLYLVNKLSLNFIFSAKSTRFFVF